jgi:dolichyl-diphosphooligosaccharide--protein glycosyltransferase
MYTLSFYRFDESQTAYGKPSGWDTVRNAEIGRKGYKLTFFEEAFTSESWIVRIFRRKPRQNREGLRFSSPSLATFPENIDEAINNSETFDQLSYKNKVVLKKKRRVFN